MSTEKESVSSLVRLPATRVYTRAHTFNIRVCVYVRITIDSIALRYTIYGITMYVHLKAPTNYSRRFT